MSRRLATRRSMSRPSTLTRMVSPIADAPALGQAGIERDQRRAVVVGRPPLPGDDPRALAAAWRHRSGRGRRAAPSAVSGVACTWSAGTPFTATTRARRLGTSLHVLHARLAVAPAPRTRGSWSFWMSTKKKLGAFGRQSGRAISRRTLPWISATAASVDRPSPTETSISGVARRAGAGWPGRAVPEGARRRGAGARRQHHRRAAEPEQRQRAQGGRAEPEREAPVGGGATTVRPTSAAATTALAAISRRRRPDSLRQQRSRGTARRRGCARRGRAARARRRARSAARSRPPAPAAPG